jgi:hypothetical protein
VFGWSVLTVLNCQAKRKSGMQKPDKYLRKHPLDIVIPASAILQNVLLFHPEPLWPDWKRMYCLCERKANTNMLGCEGCHEWYPGGCVALKGKALNDAIGDINWRCGYCVSDLDDDGKRSWTMAMSEAQHLKRKVEFKRADVDTPRAQGVAMNDPERVPIPVPSWDKINAMVEEAAKKLRAEEKKRKGKAERAIERGGHHVVDARGNGGVERRSVNGALIDELAENGDLSDGDNEADEASEISDDE